jgi:Concanavalin A-like lectin/glucanases superfamily
MSIQFPRQPGTAQESSPRASPTRGVASWRAWWRVAWYPARVTVHRSVPIVLWSFPLLAAACNVLAGLDDYAPERANADDDGAAAGGTTSSSGGGPVGGMEPGGFGGTGGSATGCKQPPPMPTPLSSSVLASAPTAYHRFELRGEPGVMWDWSGACHHGFFVGDGVYAPGLEPTTQALNVALSSGVFGEAMVVLPNADRTIEAWIKPEGSSLILTIAEITSDSVAYEHFFVLGTSAELIYATDGDSASWARTPFVYQADVWRHVAVTRTGDDVGFHIDGVAIQPQTGGPPAPVGMVQLTVGARASQEPMEAFIGLIDELAIYDRVLPNAELDAHQQAGMP